MSKIDYKSSGVNIKAGNDAVDLIKKDVKSTFTSNVLTGIGSFGSLFDLKPIIEKYKHPVLVQSIDGVGTKTIIARKLNKFDTLSDLLNSQDIDELAKWLTKQPLVREIKIGRREFIMVHAGFPKSATKKLLTEVNRKIKKALKNNPKKTLKMIFDHKRKAPKLLKDKKSLKDWVDWLTRVRAVDENEVMDLRFKGKKSELKDNFKAWFSYDLKIMKKHRSILFGHWAALEGKTNIERIHALDTGCVWNKKLTAMRLEDGRKFSVNKIN